jgi:hypothetical protein
LYADKELQPLPDIDSALAGLDHCSAYATARIQNDTDRAKKGTAEALVKSIAELKSKLTTLG